MIMDSLQSGLVRLGYQFVPFLLAVVVHEFGHGFAANLWGDTTAKDSGRLTLNPLPHLDPIGTVVFPILGMVTGMNILFGWARPVPIDPRRFRKFRPGLFWVAMAGPLANATMAILCALIFAALVRFVPEKTMFLKEFATMLQYGVYINFGLGIFNLLPLPPLDGSKVIESMLSYPAMQKYEQIAQYSTFILLALMFTGAINFLGIPITFLGNLTLTLSAMIFGIT
jgi:Zn-dependent protease